MKMKKERDKSNAALIAQFEFFFTNGIILKCWTGWLTSPQITR